MTGGGDSSTRDPLDLLVEQFLRQRRTGAATDVAAFAAAHPEHADALRDLLPTLLALEDMKRDRESTGSGRRRASVPKLDRLGEFRIVGELGRGGMGVVFEAEQESLGRRVALKVLPQAGLLTGNQLERFRREAQIAAQLHHSNIVPVFGSGESDGYHWYAMQFIEGRSLDRWRDEQALTPPTGSAHWRERGRMVARLGQQAASALHYAHCLGTLHRDIKPANLLLEHDAETPPPKGEMRSTGTGLGDTRRSASASEDREATAASSRRTSEHLWVTDFGLAKALEGEGLTHTGDLLGTLQYMAPEQFAGNYDVRSEVYALGVTLYEMLTLRPAFAGSSRSQLMERIRTQRPDALRRSCPELPEDLVVVVEKAMARDPGDRYQDAEALARDLQAFLDDRPIEARRLSTARMVWRWCRRNRAMAALAASTFLAVVGAAITGWVAYGVAGVERSKAEVAAFAEGQQKQRAEANLAIALTAFGKMFDSLVGPDPALALEEDEDTGEQTVVVRTVVDPRHVELLKEMLAFYGQFAAENAGNQTLQLETARASRRIASIHARLGKPEDLDAAANACAEALARYATVTDRDVRREEAAVHVLIGQLKQRRLRPGEAVASFQKAIDLLAALPNAETKAVRRERAEVLLAAAQNLTPRGRGGDGGPRRGAIVSELGSTDGERERVRRGTELLQACVALVDTLLAEEPHNHEYIAMRARCHLLTARLSVRRSDGGRPRPEADRAQAEAERMRQARVGTDMLRQLVAQAPQQPTYAFEFVEALLETLPRPEGPGRSEPGPPGPGRERTRDPDQVATRRVLLHEAMEHAEALFALQPDLVEYRHLAARGGTEYGGTLRDAAAFVGGTEGAALLRQAESALLVAAARAAELVAAPPAAEPRFIELVCAVRRELGSLYLATDRRDEAVAQGNLVVDLLERQLETLATGPQGPVPSRFVRMFEQRQLIGFEDLVMRLQNGPLLSRVRALRHRLPRPEGGPPEDRPPGEPRRR